MDHRVKDLVGAFLVCLAWTTVALADVPVFEPPGQATARWTKLICTGLVTVAALVIAYCLILKRGELSHGHTKWLLGSGLFAISIPAMVLSSVVGMEQSKQVQFCSSCHVMDPFVADMQDPESDLLAAVHYKNRYIQRNHCYTCHTNYGAFGTLDAKLAGMSHYWKYTTGGYELPISISKPYPYSICLNCHAESLKFQQADGHEDAIPDMLSGELACIECHEPPHPARETRVSELLQSELER